VRLAAEALAVNAKKVTRSGCCRDISSIAYI